MKKVLLSLAVVAVLTVVSCKKAETTETPTEDTTTVVVDTPAVVVDTPAVVVDTPAVAAPEAK